MSFNTSYYKDVKLDTTSLFRKVTDDQFHTTNLSDIKSSVFIDETTQLVFKPSNTGCTIGELVDTIKHISDNFTPLVESNNHNAEAINKLVFDISRDGEIFKEFGLLFAYCNKTDHTLLDHYKEIDLLSSRLNSLSIRNRVLFLSNSLLVFFLIIFLILLVNRF